MFLRYNYSLKLLFIIVVVANINCKAQNSSFEFWPETDIWYTLNSSWRFSAFVPITKYNESMTRDLNVYLQADYKWGHSKRVIYRRLVDENKIQEMKTFMVRGGYMKGWSLGDNSESYAENMLFAEIHKRTPFKNNILLSHRLKIDNRWLGDESDYSYRLRYRIMAEKDFIKGNYSIVPYFSCEPYWDSRFNTFNRFRFITGATLTLGKTYAFESNVVYQYDTKYKTENLFALNVILHIYLEKSKKF